MKIVLSIPDHYVAVNGERGGWSKDSPYGRWVKLSVTCFSTALTLIFLILGMARRALEIERLKKYKEDETLSTKREAPPNRAAVIPIQVSEAPAQANPSL